MDLPPYRVEFGPAAQRSLEDAFPEERTATGWPSFDDALSLWLPEAKVIVAQGWESAAPLVADTADDVRGVAMKGYLSIFPPSSMAVYRVPGVDSLDAVLLVVIGVSFDRELWESQRIDGLND